MATHKTHNPSDANSDLTGREAVERILHATRARRKARPQPETTGTQDTTTGLPEVRVCFYARYSSHMQDDGFSIEAQHSACERESAALAAQGKAQWRVTYYDEPARSAKEEKLDRRVRFLEAVADCIDGKFDVFAVHRLNRFARSLKVQLLVLDELQRAGAGFASLYERIDLTTPTGRLMMQQLGAFAEFESNEKADRVREAKRERARHGLPSTHAPFGYRIDRESGVAVPDENDWEGIQQFFRLCALALSDQEVADRMNADGRWRLSSPTRIKGADGQINRARPFTRNSVSEIRSNPFYRPFRLGDTHGTITYNGTTYRGQHLAACSWDDWHALQSIAVNRRRGWTMRAGPLNRPYTAEFRLLAACASCGNPLYVTRTIAHKATAANPQQEYVYEKYVCGSAQSRATCPDSRHWAFVEDVRAEWMAWASAHLQLPADWETQVEAYTARLSQGVSGEGDAEEHPDQREVRLRRELRAWNERRRRATTAYLDGLIDERETRERVAEAENAIGETEAQLRGISGHTVYLLDAGRLVREIADLWPEMTIDERIRIAGRLIEPRGLVVRVLGGTQSKRTRWDVARDIPREPSCELVTVRLRSAFAELFVAVAGTTQTPQSRQNGAETA